MDRLAATVAAAFTHRMRWASIFVEAGLVDAGALSSPSKLRYQAIFLMGAGGSGKGFVADRWLKYMPGSPGAAKQPLSDAERSLSNINFSKIVERLRSRGYSIEVSDDGSKAKIPFKLYTYDHEGQQTPLEAARWKSDLPADIFRDVAGLSSLVFSTPKHELPSYWRQVNPDIFKEELPGFKQTSPGYVHEMSSDMAKAYFSAAVATGDPLFVDGTGSNASKMLQQMQEAKDAGYRVSLVLVLVPLTVNQIRNATRPRNVSPREVTRQWKIIAKNFGTLRGAADKSKVVINRNDAVDSAIFQKERAKINNFIERETGHPDLYSYIEAVQPNELTEWGKLLRS